MLSFFKILNWFDSLFAKAFIKPTIETTPVTPSMENPTIEEFCTAIKEFEGFSPPSPKFPGGSRSYRNNNPGNCRFSSVGYASIYGEVGKDIQGFAIFKDYDTGWLYLNNLVKQKIQNHPYWTILNFFANFAPDSDGNDSRNYAQYVAGRLGVEIIYQIKNLA